VAEMCDKNSYHRLNYTSQKYVTDRKIQETGEGEAEITRPAGVETILRNM
jgi:hypothetical protein